MMLLLAILMTSPVLAASYYFGLRHGQRQEVPVWWVVLMVFLTLPALGNRWFLAIWAGWALGWAWGGRHHTANSRRIRRECRQLREALSRGEMRFYYQPIIDQFHGSVVAAEALVRWHRADGTVRFPGPWLDLVQLDEGLSATFDDQMWTDAAKMADLFPHIRFSVNTMPTRVATAGWAEGVLARIKKLDARPAQFTVEVVEGTLLQDTPVVRHNLELLMEAGCHIALDDFGEGNANMVTFMTFQDLIDTLKIDKTLIQHEDHRGATALIHLAQSFGKHVIAEGVETEAQEVWLGSEDVIQVQGWLHAKAMSPVEFAAFVWQSTGFTG